MGALRARRLLFALAAGSSFAASRRGLSRSGGYLGIPRHDISPQNAAVALP